MKKKVKLKGQVEHKDKLERRRLYLEGTYGLLMILIGLISLSLIINYLYELYYT